MIPNSALRMKTDASEGYASEGQFSTIVIKTMTRIASIEGCDLILAFLTLRKLTE
jgi:hypothetical protein